MNNQPAKDFGFPEKPLGYFPPMKPFNPNFPDFDKDLFPKIPKDTSNVYVVMETNSELVTGFSENIGKPICVCDNYSHAQMECSRKSNRFIVGPLPYHKSGNFDLTKPKFL